MTDDKSSHSKRLQLLQEDHKPKQVEQPAGEGLTDDTSAPTALVKRRGFTFPRSIIHEGRRKALSRDAHCCRLLTRVRIKKKKLTIPSSHRHTARGGERSQQRDGQSDVPVLRRGHSHAEDLEQRHHQVCFRGTSRCDKGCKFRGFQQI